MMIERLANSGSPQGWRTIRASDRRPMRETGASAGAGEAFQGSGRAPVASPYRVRIEPESRSLVACPAIWAKEKTWSPFGDALRALAYCFSRSV